MGVGRTRDSLEKVKQRSVLAVVQEGKCTNPKMVIFCDQKNSLVNSALGNHMAMLSNATSFGVLKVWRFLVWFRTLKSKVRGIVICSLVE